jgi:GT2 family glycosyltransferase
MGALEPTTIRVQSILYHNDKTAIGRGIASLAAACRFAKYAGVVKGVDLALGDCSHVSVIDDEAMTCFQADYGGFITFDYSFFRNNLGSAAGHNRLLEHAEADYVLIMNPDVIMGSNTLVELLKPFAQADVGIVEAKQIPIEHPKDYNTITGETSWASTACALTKRRIAEQLNGFDAPTFFLYCDDVDFSWRTRLLGYKVIFQPSAVIFHDKKLSKGGKWIASEAEKYYSAEAALMLAYKWSREDILEQTLLCFKASNADWLQKAAKTFEQLRDTNKLPRPLDADHRVAQFIDGNYATHRFSL